MFDPSDLGAWKIGNWNPRESILSSKTAVQSGLNVEGIEQFFDKAGRLEKRVESLDICPNLANSNPQAPVGTVKTLILQDCKPGAKFFKKEKDSMNSKMDQANLFVANLVTRIADKMQARPTCWLSCISVVAAKLITIRT